MARELTLPPAFVDRVRQYYLGLQADHVEERDPTMSDYWVGESQLVKIQFEGDKVRVEGSQGFYLPPSAKKLKTRASTYVRRLSKRAVVAADRVIGGSEEHALASSRTQDLAYDYVMRGDVAIDYGGNPFRFNHTKLRPLFKTSSELRRKWFLRNRYFANENILTTAYRSGLGFLNRLDKWTDGLPRTNIRPLLRRAHLCRDVPVVITLRSSKPKWRWPR